MCEPDFWAPVFKTVPAGGRHECDVTCEWCRSSVVTPSMEQRCSQTRVHTIASLSLTVLSRVIETWTETGTGERGAPGEWSSSFCCVLTNVDVFNPENLKPEVKMSVFYLR